MTKKLLLFSVSLFLLMAFTLQSQSVKVVRVAMSPGDLKLSSTTAINWPISSGLRNVGIGNKVYLDADTAGSGATAVTSFEWTFVEKPVGSTTVMDSGAAKKMNSFKADQEGRYIVQIKVNGTKTHADTITATRYVGMAGTGLTCSSCHAAQSVSYNETKHATIYKRGITGQLEANTYGVGVYSGFCAKCHTTGYDANTDNGNFSNVAVQTGWDTTWYKPAASPTNVGINYGDSTRLMLLYNNYRPVYNMANIGCESCHGPGQQHKNLFGAKGTIGTSLDASVCDQCHDAPAKHQLASLWRNSHHSKLTLSSSAASRSGCWPCHNGEAFVAYTNNKAAPNYTKVNANFASISCATCHDPHAEENEYQLRTIKLDSLMNGYKPAQYFGGLGQFCMNCHRARTNSELTVKNQQIRFADRFYPHYSPQADMFLGANGIEYGLKITGIGTHKGLEKGCITCHMQTWTSGPAMHSNHTMTMAGNEATMIKGCRECHGNWINTYDDITAATDYDGNGKIEGVQTEIKGMLAKLKDILPKDNTGEPVNMAADSMKVKNDPNWPNNLGAIYNYYFVKNDWSYGIHNTKYAAALLQASLGKLTGVEVANIEIPKQYSLSQNYPNPFNPSTEIKFSVPRAATVSLQVYNSVGQLVRTLSEGELLPGNYTVKWDGKDNSNTLVASGVYIYRLSAASNGQINFVQSKKMIMLK